MIRFIRNYFILLVLGFVAGLCSLNATAFEPGFDMLGFDVLGKAFGIDPRILYSASLILIPVLMFFGLCFMLFYAKSEGQRCLALVRFVVRFSGAWAISNACGLWTALVFSVVSDSGPVREQLDVRLVFWTGSVSFFCGIACLIACARVPVTPTDIE